MAYTYQDFENAANQAGLLGQFSQYDLDLAQRYPEAGLSILSLKKDYGNATTDEQRILANEAANQIRSSYGNYTANQSGNGYISTGRLPTEIDNVLDKIGSFGSFDYGASAPVYNNAYAEQQQALLDAVINRPDFSWSKETDPLWPSYKKSYLREGERATANALGQASAASGGRASSYAVNAATQAGDYYATKLNDIIPTLYQQAYDRYLQDYQMKLSDLNAVNTQEQLDYSRYLTDLGQFNTDRSQAYNEYLNEYNMLQTYLGNLQGQDATEYNRYLDRVAQRQQELDNQMALAQLGGSYGDYAGLNSLGITPDTQNVYQLALANAAREVPVGSGRSGGSGGSGRGGSSSGSGGNTDTVQAAVNAFQAGDRSDATIQALLDAGYTEADIKAAGYTGDYFTRNGGRRIVDAWERLTPQQLEQQRAELEAHTGLSSVTNYDSAISYMRSAGVDSSVRSGLMTRNEWTRRKASLSQYGTGSAEVKNYNSYQDYVRDYCEYATGK